MANKPEKKKVKKVIRRTRPEPKPWVESLNLALSYVVSDVLIPRAKDTLSQAIMLASDSVIYGPDGVRPKSISTRPSASRHRPDKDNPYTDYRGMSGGKKRTKASYERSREISPRTRATHKFDDIVLDSRAEADDTIEQMIELISQYGVATVADLYSYLDIEPKHTDYDWGWLDLRGAHARSVRHGFMLVLPEPEYVD